MVKSGGTTERDEGARVFNVEVCFKIIKIVQINRFFKYAEKGAGRTYILK